MKKTIEKKVYDTEKDTHIAQRFAGEFGTSGGFEEQLFITKDKQHYIYGVGGSESPYPKPTIALLTDEEAENWKKENIAE
jgi:hypothetical protein